MRVRVDESKCEAYGLCEADAPAIFELDEAGYAHVTVDQVPPEMADLARRAVVGCPMRAITITAEESWKKEVADDDDDRDI